MPIPLVVDETADAELLDVRVHGELCNTDKDGFDKKDKTSGVMVAVDNDGYAIHFRELYRRCAVVQKSTCELKCY